MIIIIRFCFFTVSVGYEKYSDVDPLTTGRGVRYKVQKSDGGVCVV